MAIIIKGQLNAGIFYDKDVDVYVTFVPALGIYSQGETKREAKLAIKDAVDSFLEVSYKKGVLEKLVKNAHFISEDEYIKVEKKIFKEKKFKEFFEISPSFPPLSLEVA